MAPKTIKHRLPSLDGIRALAIFLVLASHSVNGISVQLPLIDGTIFGKIIREIGHYGVVLFFTLSGYLITSLLIREKSTTNKISLIHFWWRRGFRIFPVFYTYLVIVALLVTLGYFEIHSSSFAVAATYTWNYQFLFIDSSLGLDSSILGHFWSLAVEEQFYCVYPVVFALCAFRTTFKACLILIAITPLIRLGQYFMFPASRDFGPIMAHTVIGTSIAIGCAFRLAEHLNTFALVRSVMSSAPAFVAGLMVGFLIDPWMKSRFAGMWAVPVGESLLGLSAMTMLAYGLRTADTSVVGRVLNLRFVAWLGTISYSIYIWQQLIYHIDIPLFHGVTGRLLATFTCVAVAATSYYFLERPMLGVRDILWRRLFSAEAPTVVNPESQAVT